MTKLYSGNQRNYNKQLATAYAAYMIASSLYKKCIIKNPYEEKHLYLHYSELSDSQQIQAESKVLHHLGKLPKNLSDVFKNMYCEVTFFENTSGDYSIFFSTGGFESLRIQITSHSHIYISLL